MLLTEAIKPRIVAIYPGRFQPMGKHHFTAYKHLVSKFGAKNVFVATSDATGDKSPFNFNEKKKIISAAGVPAKQIVKVKNPYKAEEITSKLPDNTIVTFAVGEKDGDRLAAGKYFNHYKDGEKMVSYKKGGYIYTLPHVALKVGGKEMSGTTIRKALGNKKLSTKQRQKLFADITGIKNPSVFKMVTSKLSEGLMLEGGASGHMAHPWENIDMSFAEMKKMITALLSGEMSVNKISEKTDGQNLNITYHNGEVVAARNKTQSKNFGANGLTIAAIKKMFAGRGELEKAFVSAMEDLNKSINGLTEKQKSRIFDNGRNWINLEIIYQPTRNVIPYNTDLLQFHGINKFDAEGNKLGTSAKEGRELAGMIKQISQNKQKTFDIIGPVAVELPKSQDFSAKQAAYIKKITDLQRKYGLSNKDSLLQYHRKFWLNMIEKEARKNRVKLSRDLKVALVKRFAEGNKSFALNKKNIKDEKVYEFARKLDKVDSQALFEKNVRPFEDVFLSLGADVLENARNFIAVSPEKGIKDIRKDISQTISTLRKGGDRKKMSQLKKQLMRIKRAGGFTKIVPSEGIVFDYKGNTYKLTGVFAPINQIVGMTKF